MRAFYEADDLLDEELDDVHEDDDFDTDLEADEVEEDEDMDNYFTGDFDEVGVLLEDEGGEFEHEEAEELAEEHGELSGAMLDGTFISNTNEDGDVEVQPMDEDDVPEGGLDEVENYYNDNDEVIDELIAESDEDVALEDEDLEDPVDATEESLAELETTEESIAEESDDEEVEELEEEPAEEEDFEDVEDDEEVEEEDDLSDLETDEEDEEDLF